MTMGLALILLTFSGSYTQALGAAGQFDSASTRTLSSVFLEEMKIVAGINTAALVKITTVGGPSALKITPESLLQLLEVLQH